jgi:methylamine dehydrogenase heavy chain
MLRALPLCLAVFLTPFIHAADLEPELGGVETMAKPDPHWLLTIGFLGGAYIWDAQTGEMQGKLNVSDYTSAVGIDEDRGMIYVPGSYYSRGTYGDRTDVLVFNDLSTLAPVAEVEVPEKLAAVFHRAVINPVGSRYVGLYNMTPAMSVSIVDVEKREYIDEISTAGCAFVYPVSGRRFMQLCGDGTVQVISLDRNGREDGRVRSRKFFDVEEDPVFDFAVPNGDDWILISFAGLVYEVTVGDGDDIEIAEPWSILTDSDREDGWRIGGGDPMAFNAEAGVLFTLMHQGGPDTHEDDGTHVWAFDFSTRRRGYELELDAPMSSLGISQDDAPLLYITGGFPNSIAVHDAVTGHHLRTIEQAGMFGGHVQTFSGGR